jgi:excisionase family DNA binding protein
MALLALTHPTCLSEAEATLAVRSSKDLASFANGDPSIANGDPTLRLTISRDNGESMEAIIPTFALKILADVLREISKGNPVTLLPENAELSTNEAAHLLSISRPFLIKNFLDTGKIPCRKVGNHRRIRYADILTYLAEEKKNSIKILEEMMAYEEELGLYNL